MSKHTWIRDSIRHIGGLHQQMGIKHGEKIPKRRLMLAANSKNKLLARRARLAMTLESFHKG